MPPEPERDWKTLEEEVRRKLTATQDAKLQTRSASVCPPITSTSKSCYNEVISSSRTDAGNNRGATPPLLSAENQHIDFNLYADSLLDEDELWKDLED